MAHGLAGDQWNEGDVSCSVVRRVVLPDAFFAIDGVLETTLTVLKQMEVFPAVIARETERYLPFLLTTTFLMEAVKAGVGRETAHEAIKEHAVATVRDLRDGKTTVNNLLDRLAQDSRLKTTRARLDELFEAGSHKTGAAAAQVEAIASTAAAWVGKYPAAAKVQPGEIL
jgi:adenylosuccinate lyase